MKVKKTIKLQVLVTEKEKESLDQYLATLLYPVTIPAFIRQLIAERVNKSEERA